MTFEGPSVWSNLSFFISGLGWAVHWWPVERCPSTADLLPPVQEVPSLLPTKPWPLQGQEARLDGAGSQADLEAGKRASMQLQGAGEALKNKYPFQTRATTHQHFCFNGKFLKQDLRRLGQGPTKNYRKSKVLEAFEGQYFLSSVESLSDLEKWFDSFGFVSDPRPQTLDSETSQEYESVNVVTFFCF